MPQRAFELSRDLLRVVYDEHPRLAAISETEAQARRGGGHGWSGKQELGHLIDSAANNRIRFMIAALEGAYTGPTYDGEGWVRLGGYSSFDWSVLVELWSDLNRALATLIANIPDERLTAKCQVGAGPSVTLGFLIEDYALHMQHHLDHLLGREVSTSYPGANMGV